MYLEKIEKEAQRLLEKFNCDIELAIACANECYIALSQLPHLSEESSNAIYKELDFYRDVIEELNEMPVEKPCPSDNADFYEDDVYMPDFYEDGVEEMPVHQPCPSDNGYNLNDYK